MNHFDASSMMTVISLVTFLGIVWWAYITKSQDDFSEAEQLPFSDEQNNEAGQTR